MAHDLRSNLDQLLSKRRQRLMFHPLGQGERAQEVAQVVRQGVRLKTHLIVAEAVAGGGVTVRPVDGRKYVERVSS